MNKAKVIDLKAENSVMKERLYLSKMRNNFIVNMICSFQDLNNLYLGLDLIKGGDLRYHLINHTETFTEGQVKFLASNLVLGLEYIHQNKIVHRDIKPENILFDNRGYAYITDFNISCRNEEINNLYDISGTPVYMAPESISQKFQNFTVDFYSLGIILYECIMGRRPYEGYNRNEVKKYLMNNDIVLEKTDRISFPCISFINGLLTKNPAERLGSHSDTLELRENLFFKGFNWDILRRKKYVSPIAEIIEFARKQNSLSEELFDAEYCNKIDEIDEMTKIRYSQITAHENYPNYFRQYTFLSREAVKEIAVQYKLPGAIPKKPLSISRSSENINLPQIRTKYSHQRITDKSNGGSKYSLDSKGYTKDRKKSYLRKKLGIPKEIHNMRDYYKYKLDKYLQKLRNSENYPPYPNMMYGFVPNPMDMNPYMNRKNLNGNDVYNDVILGLQRKIYKDVFGGVEEDYDDRKRKYNGIPNQYQINNYFIPPNMIPGMAMPNPYYPMMLPYGMLPPINPEKFHHTKGSKLIFSSKYSSNKKSKSKKSEQTKSKKTKTKEKSSESKSEESSSSSSEEEESEEESDDKNKKENDKKKESKEDEESEESKESEDESKEKDDDKEGKEGDEEKKEENKSGEDEKSSSS